MLVPGPPEEGTVIACVRDIAGHLGLDSLPRMTMDAVMEGAAAKGIQRLILLVDEADQYVLLGKAGEFARAWFNRLEALRKAWIDRVSVVIAGGLGILHIGHVLGSGLLSRAETCVVERFGIPELQELAEPFATHGRRLDDSVIETLQALSGGNPALATYGLEQLWPSDNNPIQDLRTAFGEFMSRHGDFLRAVQDAVSHSRLVAAPGRILDLVRQSAGSVPQQMLREACAVDDPPVDVAQAVQLLQAAGLVDVSGSLYTDPLQIHAVASIVNLPTHRAADANPSDRFDADVAAVLVQLHRVGRDFHGKAGLLEEQVFSSMLAVGLRLLGWSAVDREVVQAAGYPDLRVRLSQGDVHGHVVVETKIWPRNDYKNIQTQIDAYRVSDTIHAVAVMLGTRDVAGWVEDYEHECLGGCTVLQRSHPLDLVARWRIESRSDGPQTMHFLVQIPKRT